MVLSSCLTGRSPGPTLGNTLNAGQRGTNAVDLRREGLTRMGIGRSSEDGSARSGCSEEITSLREISFPPFPSFPVSPSPGFRFGNMGNAGNVFGGDPSETCHLVSV
jgi:hypothetical protein